MSKIIVAGDSIAYGKWDAKGGWVARLRKYVDEEFNIGKGNNFQVFNLGIPGEVIPRLAKRFEQELIMRILPEDKDRRDLVIFAVGINDSCPNNWMTLKQTPKKEFKDSLRNMIDVAQEKGCKVIVVGLTPVNPARSNGLQFTDAEVEIYDGYITDVCNEKQIQKLELFRDLRDSGFSNLLLDVVHPNDDGHNIIFNKIIDFLKASNILQYLIS